MLVGNVLPDIQSSSGTKMCREVTRRVKAKKSSWILLKTKAYVVLARLESTARNNSAATKPICENTLREIGEIILYYLSSLVSTAGESQYNIARLHM